jgi:hypothetical protein
MRWYLAQARERKQISTGISTSSGVHAIAETLRRQRRNFASLYAKVQGRRMDDGNQLTTVELVTPVD